MNVTNDVSQMVSLYQTALETSGLNNVEIAASEDGKSLTVTMYGTDGQVTGTSSIGIPEIDIPAGNSVGNSEQLNAFIGEINSTVKSLAKLDDETFATLEKNVQAGVEKYAAEVAAAQSSGSESTGKVSALYCIYKLMALMLDVAREQREVARETRAADTQMMLNTMESQRQAMISEAVTGMICCGCVALLQLGIEGVSAYKSASVSSMKNDASLAAGDKTFKKVAGMAANSGNAEKLDAAKLKAEAKFDAATNKMIDKDPLPPEEHRQVDEAKSSLNTEFDQINTGPGDNDAKAQQRTEIYERCKTERDAVKTEFLKAADEGTLNDALRRKMDFANAKVEYAAACKLSAEAQPGQTPSANKVDEFKVKASVDGAKAAGERRMTFSDEIAEKDLSNQKFNQISTIFATLVKGLADHGLELQKAEDKKYDQSIATEQSKLDSSKDLVQNSLDMFKQMLSVLSSIAESEKSTFREIMG